MTAVLLSLVSLVTGAIVTWAVAYFAPGVWRHVARRPHLNVHVEVDRSVVWAGNPPWVTYAFMIPSTDGLGEPPSDFCPDWWAWARSLGAIDADETEVQLTFTAATDTTVVIDGFQAKIVKRETPPSWPVVQCQAGGADITKRGVRIDLDGFATPTTSFVDRGFVPMKQPPAVSVSRGEAEVFLVTAEARFSYIEWTADALLIVDGKRRTLTIDDAGKPFRTCARGKSPMHLWRGDAGWHVENPNPTP